MKTDLYKLADYVLLNAYSISSTGFYNGKAGLSLCLFEVSRLWKDEYLEEHAFELLQEALLTKNEHVDFEDGLGGIGFVLLYLIQNGFVDADFEELFGLHLYKIIERTRQAYKQPEKIHLYLQLLYLFKLLNRKEASLLLTFLVKDILKGTEQMLDKRFSAFLSWTNRQPKIETLCIFQHYLKVVSFYRDESCNYSIVEKYLDLHRRCKIANDFITGYCLEEIGLSENMAEWIEAGRSIQKSGLKNLYPVAMPLSERIDILYRLEQSGDRYKSELTDLKNSVLDKTGRNLEEAIVRYLSPDKFMAGYGSGGARLLLYLVYQNTPTTAGRERFKCLFN